MTENTHRYGAFVSHLVAPNRHGCMLTVDEEVISSIGRGLCVLVGISRNDTQKEIEYLVRKILNLRVFEDDEKNRWKKSVLDKQYEILCVSQFTLMCKLKGNKPDFHESMSADSSEQFYQKFLSQLGAAYNPEKIKDGKFGAYMQVDIQNDGPVTIPLETPQAVEKNSKKPTVMGEGATADTSGS